MIFPHSRFDPLITITPFSEESLGGSIASMQKSINGTASAAWATANMAYFYPFYISRRTTVQQLFLMNGATAAGNVDMGIYSSDGTRIVSAGSTAQSGTNAIQALSITATQLSAGVYYLAIAMSSTSATIFSVAVFNSTFMKTTGAAQMASAFPLPATATLATTGSGIAPLIALTTRSVI